MADIESPITELDTDRSWDLLASQSMGRLAASLDDAPEIFPVNFVVDGEDIVFRTAEGTKLFLVVANENVAFEVDSWNEENGWSVVARGRASVIDGSTSLARAEALPLRPWVPTVKTVFVRIAVDQITGRRFEFGPDPIDRFRY